MGENYISTLRSQTSSDTVKNSACDAILKSASAPLSHKEVAFSYFVTQYQQREHQNISAKIKRFIPFLNEKEDKARDIFQEAAMRLWQNIKGGELLNSDSTAEAWFRQIVKGETQNELRRNSVRPTKKQTSENDDNDGDGANNGNDRGNCVSEKQACQPRLIDFDSLCVQFFGSENEVDETENTAHLREQLDLLINKVPATCKQLFSQMVVEYLGSLDDEPVETMEKAQKTTKSAEYDFLFDWWKKNKAQGKDLSDAKTLKDVRNSFDVTLSKCRKTIQHLHNESLINFFHNDN